MRLVELRRALFSHEARHELGIHQLVFRRTEVRLLLDLLATCLHREARCLREQGLAALGPQRATCPLLDHKTVRPILQHLGSLALLALLVLTLALVGRDLLHLLRVLT